MRRAPAPLHLMKQRHRPGPPIRARLPVHLMHLRRVPHGSLVHLPARRLLGLRLERRWRRRRGHRRSCNLRRLVRVMALELRPSGSSRARGGRQTLRRKLRHLRPRGCLRVQLGGRGPGCVRRDWGHVLDPRQGLRLRCTGARARARWRHRAVQLRLSVAGTRVGPRA